jgi:signal transduction histidine kinase
MTVAAVAIVGVALVGGGIALVIVLRDTLTDQVRTSARLRAHDLADSLGSGSSPAQVTDENDDDLLVQVLDDRGDVIAASPDARHDRAMAHPQPGASTEIGVLDEKDHETDKFLAVASTVDTAEGARTVIVARVLDPVTDSTHLVRNWLLIGLPLLLLLVAVTTWKLVGRALAPVEAMRAEVDEISAAALDRRVPQPAGRDEIARLASTMNEMLDRLEQAQKRQREFVSDASHELRSPVASIREQAEVALAHPDRTTTSELAESVLAEDLRVQKLVEDLLLLTRADEQTLPLGRRPVDLDDLVFEEARRLRTDNGLRIDTTGVSAARVMGDESALRRVVVNLAENAARHARTKVSFALKEESGSAVLDIADDGPGIPEADRARVFERFVRLDDARARDDGGSGLGLAIVAQLVAAHSGTVQIADDGTVGTRIQVRIPGRAAGT